MKRGQLLLAIFAALAVGAVAWFAGGPGNDEPATKPTAGAKAPAGAIRVTFAYSPEKEKLLLPLIKSFNGEREEVGGRPVFVEGINAASGDAESRIAKGTFKPVAWSPASSLWGRLLNFEADRPYTAEEAPSIVRTPLVIAMWEPMARALGHPRKKLGFADILRLATSGKGWADFGKPEFGAFKLVHTNPDFSTSGLSAVVAEYYAATGKKEGLTEKDLADQTARKRVRDIERSIVHYGDTTLFIAEQLKKEGPGYASAVAMEEVTLLDFNRTRGDREKLVAIYPEEGTFDSDSPFFTLNAPWVSSEQAEGAKAFQEYLADEISPEVAAKSGFRPSDRAKAPVAPITVENGADPKQPERVLQLPEPRVLAGIKKAWRRDRKPANILLVLDTSGSMNEEDRLKRAKAGLDVFFRNVEPQDAVGLTIFADKVQPLVAPAPLSKNAAQLRGRVRDLFAEGGTAFYDATVEAFDSVRAQNATDRINAVVLLTDGEDTDSQRNVDDVVQHLQGQGDSPNQVRVFTIAYSSGASGARGQLKRIAAASGGLDYEGKTENIESVYRSISSFF
ncbi:MAG TPA: VWA domain-containing protein [Solirubrobacteraceae bacterium]|nr:VWA domain-containing protein [Solirubrobacteraceae bacterium]